MVDKTAKVLKINSREMKEKPFAYSRSDDLINAGAKIKV
jgi:hypothetical protein